MHLSSLPHTWIIDIDGTILKHNGHKTGEEELLNGVVEFWGKIPGHDKIILISAREERFRESTLEFITSNGLRYDYAIFDAPQGERILINDVKPSGLNTAYAVNTIRDEGLANLDFFELKARVSNL